MLSEVPSVKDYYATNFRAEFTLYVTAINQWKNLSRNLIEIELENAVNQISAIESELQIIESYLAECSQIGNELPAPDKYWNANKPEEDYRYGCASLDLYAYELQSKNKLYEESVFKYCVQKKQELKKQYLEHKVKVVMASIDLGMAPNPLDLGVVENHLKQTLQQTFQYSTATYADITQDYLKYCQNKIRACDILLQYIYQNKSTLGNINTLLIKAGALMVMEMFGEAESIFYNIVQAFEDYGPMIVIEGVYYDVTDMLVASLIGQSKHSQALKVLENAIELVELQQFDNRDLFSHQKIVYALKIKQIQILLDDYANQIDTPKYETLEQAADLMNTIIGFLNPIVQNTLDSYQQDLPFGDQIEDNQQMAIIKTVLSMNEIGLCKEVLILFNKLRVFHPSYQPPHNLADYLFEESSHLIPQTEILIKRDFLQAYLLMDKNPTSSRQIYQRYTIAEGNNEGDSDFLTKQNDSNNADRHPPVAVKSRAEFEDEFEQYYAYINLAHLGILNCSLTELINTHKEKSLDESYKMRSDVIKQIQRFKNETLFSTSIRLSQKDINMLHFLSTLNELTKELESPNFDPKSKAVCAFINICKKRLVLDL